ncbi:hypothetical protein ES288_A08G089300v1 [Gossypium darwinii]|uniref:Uncharacterized protein n=1 Tax=Gossypium darwinii TaxID=34276 RepID=A0A5D2FII2_GOSDA|nr:hypothetical protein ES288_A08G089300v1 [Gossypium darwinii]
MEATSRASNIGRSVSNSRNDYRKESDSLSKTEIVEKLTQDLPSIPNPSSIIESPSHDNHSNLINPGKNIGETIKDCPAQSSLQTMQESIKISTSGFLDAAKHSAVLFKDDSQSTTKGHTQKNRAKTGFHHAELTATRGVLKARNSRKVKNLKVNKEKESAQQDSKRDSSRSPSRGRSFSKSRSCSRSHSRARSKSHRTKPLRKSPAKIRSNSPPPSPSASRFCSLSGYTYFPFPIHMFLFYQG